MERRNTPPARARRDEIWSTLSPGSKRAVTFCSLPRTARRKEKENWDEIESKRLHVSLIQRWTAAGLKVLQKIVIPFFDCRRWYYDYFILCFSEHNNVSDICEKFQYKNILRNMSIGWNTSHHFAPADNCAIKMSERWTLFTLD